MARAIYVETPCKSAINRVEGMPFKWSLNPYRGCVHACHYCYARASHSYFGLNAGEDFETQIFVKTNLPAVLRKELGRKSWLGESVAIGTVTDPYQPAEGRYRLTRGALEALRDFQNPVSITTKSTLVQRDIDLLAELARLSEVRVHLTITTLDSILWRLVEPGTPPPQQRLNTVRRLTDAGITVGVSIAPILPGITDSEEAIDALAAAARAHGATILWGGAIRLAPLVKEHYLEFIAANFPGLLGRYQRTFAGGAYAPRAYAERIEALVNAARERHGFNASSRYRVPPQPPDRPLHLPQQLTLFAP